MNKKKSNFDTDQPLNRRIWINQIRRWNLSTDPNKKKRVKTATENPKIELRKKKNWKVGGEPLGEGFLEKIFMFDMTVHYKSTTQLNSTTWIFYKPRGGGINFLTRDLYVVALGL